MKLLVIILTSSKIHLLKRAIKSAQNQQPIKFPYDVKVVVNTLKEEYYQLVLKEIKGVEIIRTKSNGSPGMGHNSCLKVFQDRPEYTHFAMLDGDDLYYPVAFQRFEKMLEKEPELDLVHLLLNDRVHFLNPENFNSKQLKFNYKLVSSFRENSNWWERVDTKSPLINRIEDTKTPSRIILTSRKIFKTTHPIRYSEDMKLYDDMISFFSFYEAQLRGELNTFSTSETNIYLYNSLNDHSASYNFKEQDRENVIFQKELAIYTEAIKDNWNIKKLPFLKIDQPTNFTTSNKMDFCNKEVVDFEIANKYDKLKNLQDLNILKKDTKKLAEVENLFSFLINGGFDSPNNLLKMAEIKFIKNDINTGLVYLLKLSRVNPVLGVYKKIFEILFSYKIYQRCEYFYKMIENYGGLTDKIKEQYKVIKTNIYSENNFRYSKDGKFQLKLDESKEILCYYTGYTGDWDGENYGEKNVYGSEIAAIKLAEKMTKDYNVIVLCNCSKVKLHNGVYYLNQANFVELNNNYKVNHLVISRYIAYTVDVDLTKVDNIYFIMHDARVHDVWHDKSVPMLATYVFKNFSHKLKKIVCVSKWQKENFQNMLKLAEVDIPDEKYTVIGNGINTELFKKVEKKKNRFLSCSDPTRGLSMTCEILVELQKKYNDITLDIYFGTLPQDIRNYVNKYDFINYHGKVSNNRIIEEMCKSEFFLYTNINSHETFCISVLEAMCGGNVVLTRDFSAPPELVGDSGILIPKELEGYGLKRYTIEKIDNILKNNLKKEYQDKAHKRSLEYDWKNVAEKWYNLLKN